MFKPIQFRGEFIEKYWDGPTNRFARYMTYFMRSVDLSNQIKYLLALVGLGVFKADITIPLWITIIGSSAIIPVGILVGRWHIFYVSKAQQALSMRNESLTGADSFNMQVWQTHILEAIAGKLGVQVSELKKQIFNG